MMVVVVVMVMVMVVVMAGFFKTIQRDKMLYSNF